MDLHHLMLFRLKVEASNNVVEAIEATMIANVTADLVIIATINDATVVIES